MTAAAVMLGVGIYQFILKFRNCYTSYFSCTNRIPYVWSFIISSFAGVLLTVIMLEAGMGVWGMILAQLISQMVFNMWYWTRKAHREMGLGLGDTVRFGWDELKKIV